MSAKVVELGVVREDPKAVAELWAKNVRELIMEGSEAPRAVVVLVLRHGDEMALRYGFGSGSSRSELIGLLARAQAKCIELFFESAELVTEDDKA